MVPLLANCAVFYALNSIGSLATDGETSSIFARAALHPPETVSFTPGHYSGRHLDEVFINDLGIEENTVQVILSDKEMAASQAIYP